MKNTALILSAAILLPIAAQAGDDIVALEKISKNSNLYRPVPRGTMIPHNRGGEANGGGYAGSVGGGRSQNSYFKPTQHYYTKDAVISYRYAEDQRSARGERSYLGPNASYFDPHRQALAPNTSIRSLAHVEHTKQPGVPMRAKRWSEGSANNFQADSYHRHVDSKTYYHGGNVDPSSRGTRVERAER